MFIMAISQLVGLFFLVGSYVSGDSSAITTQIELVDTVQTWSSPCWGYNAPKIVRNTKGELWAVTFRGKYGEEQAQIMKREVSGTWKKGKKFDHLYQPSMIFLDAEGRLNYIQNSQKEMIKHYRSTDNENLNNFQLVANGNGVEDGRGWYVGVGIYGSTMYLAYVTLQYDLFLTWKQVTDTSWHKAVLLEPGEVDTARGNHSWLYPRFTFHRGKGYITVSSTEDGSKYNTYDKVCLVTFSLDNPSDFTKETIFDGTVGYYSYSYDAIITTTDKIVCGFNAGKYKYGKKKKDVMPEGIYVSVKDINNSKWDIYQIDSHSGGIALHEGSEGVLYALVTRGSWDTENTMLLKRSVDGAKTWTIVDKDLLKNRPDIKHEFFLQLAHSQSGSMPGAGIDGLFTNHHQIAPVDGLYSFDVLYLHIDLHR